MNKTPPLTRMAEQPQYIPKVYHRGFDDLPNELKLHILKYALMSERPVTAKSYPDLEARLGINVDGLFLTNKAMHALAAEVYYSSNTFIVERSYGTDDIRIVYDEGNYSFHYPPYKFGHFVGRLRLQLDVHPYYTRSTEKLLERTHSGRSWCSGWTPRFSDWLTPMRPREYLEDDGTEWQAHFPNLDELNIELNVRFSSSSCLTDSTKAHLKGLPEHALIDLSPKKVEIIVDNFPCQQGARYGEPCKGDCAGIIRNTVRSMVRLRDNGQRSLVVEKTA